MYRQSTGARCGSRWPRSSISCTTHGGDRSSHRSLNAQNRTAHDVPGLFCSARHRAGTKGLSVWVNRLSSHRALPALVIV